MDSSEKEQSVAEKDQMLHSLRAILDELRDLSTQIASLSAWHKAYTPIRKEANDGS